MLPSMKLLSTTKSRPSQVTVKELAEIQLRSKPYMALENISCEEQKGVLVLRGCLPTYYLKQVAQEAVKQIEGLDGIDNQIQVVARGRNLAG